MKMTIKKVLEGLGTYLGASGIKIPNVYDNKIPKKKKLPKLKKSVYGVDSPAEGGSDGGAE